MLLKSFSIAVEKRIFRSDQLLFSPSVRSTEEEFLNRRKSICR